jgi:hypothetical protein
MIRLPFQILVIIAGLALSSAAQAIDLSQSLDKASIAYEEQAFLTITIRWSGNQSAYLFDRPVQPTLDKLRVQKFATSVASQATDVGEVTTKTFTFALAPTGSGTARIEPMAIHYVSWPDSLPGDLMTSEMTLSVAPAKPVAKSTSWLGELPLVAWIAIVIIAVGSLGIGTFLFLKKRMKPVVEVKSPSTALLESLTALKADAGSDLKRFQTGVYKLLVAFVHDQFKIDISGRSAEEIAQAMEAVNLPETSKEKLSGWLLRADREKFSPLPPAPGETIRLEAELRQFFESQQSRQ